MESEYKSKKTGELKTTKRTETVQKEESIAELVDEFIDMWNDYLVHRYQIENDKFQWSKIFDTDQQYGTIHHLDFSDPNLSLNLISTRFTALLLIHLMRMPSTNTFIIFQMTLPMSLNSLMLLLTIWWQIMINV